MHTDAILWMHARTHATPVHTQDMVRRERQYAERRPSATIRHDRVPPSAAAVIHEADAASAAGEGRKRKADGLEVARDGERPVRSGTPASATKQVRPLSPVPASLAHPKATPDMELDVEEGEVLDE